MEVCPFEMKSLIGWFSLATNQGNWPFHIILSKERDQSFEVHRTNWHEVSKIGKIAKSEI